MSSTMPLGARVARAVRRTLRLDRERRWNKEYAEGSWDWLGNIDEMAHHAVLAGYAATLKPGGTLLDVGCGDGVFHGHLRGVHGRYVGVDFQVPVAKARVRAAADATASFVAADMNDFTTDERFDLVVFNESIYYHSDPRGGIQRYAGYLKPDGVMLVSMHGKERNDALWALLDELFTTIDAVTMVNRRGVKWTVKALVPPGTTFSAPRPT